MMPPEDNYMDFLMAMLYANPEWVGGAGKNAHYAPPDIGSQASQLNFIQDMMKGGADPLLGILTGAFNEESLQPTIVEPAVTTGADRLRQIIEASPNSVEAFIAAEIEGGNTAEGAIEAASAAGLIKPGARLDAEGKPIKNAQGYTEVDTSVVDRYRKTAEQLWNMKLEDRPAVTQEHPFIQRMLDAGFTDPRQQYTPEYINAGGLEAANQQQQSSVDAFYKAAAKASALDNVGGYDTAPRGRAHRRDGYDPQDRTRSLEIDGRKPFQREPDMAQIDTTELIRNSGGHQPSNISGYTYGPEISTGTNPLNRERRVEGAPRGAAGRSRAYRGDGRRNNTRRASERQDTEQLNRSRSHAFRRAEAAGNNNLWQQIKTQRAARMLQQQNGTPFQAEFAQRLAALRSMGIQ